MTFAYNNLKYEVTTEERKDGTFVIIARDGLTFEAKVNGLKEWGGDQGYCERTGFMDAEQFWNPPAIEEKAESNPKQDALESIHSALMAAKFPQESADAIKAGLAVLADNT